MSWRFETSAQQCTPILLDHAWGAVSEILLADAVCNPILSPRGGRALALKSYTLRVCVCVCVCVCVSVCLCVCVCLSICIPSTGDKPPKAARNTPYNSTGVAIRFGLFVLLHFQPQRALWRSSRKAADASCLRRKATRIPSREHPTTLYCQPRLKKAPQSPSNWKVPGIFVLEPSRQGILLPDNLKKVLETRGRRRL